MELAREVSSRKIHMLRIIFSVAVLFIQSGMAQTDAATTTGLYFGKAILPNLNGNVEVFTKVPSISLEKCVQECKTRDECSSIYYVRRSTMCYILINVTSTTKWSEDFVRQRAGSVFGVKNEWKAQTTTQITQPAKECGPPPAVPNARISGNMYQIGSKLKYDCGPHNYPETAFATCGTDGQWNPQPILCPSLDAATISKCNSTGEVWVRNGSCYILPMETTMDHVSAKDKCKQLSGHLVTIANEAEQNFINRMLNHYVMSHDFKNDTDVGKASRVYIGLAAGPDKCSEKVFQWSDDTPFEFKNWGEDEPNGKTEHCVALGPIDSYVWADFVCNKQFYPLCEVELL